MIQPIQMGSKEDKFNSVAVDSTKTKKYEQMYETYCQSDLFSYFMKLLISHRFGNADFLRKK